MKETAAFCFLVRFIFVSLLGHVFYLRPADDVEQINVDIYALSRFRYNSNICYLIPKERN